MTTGTQIPPLQAPPAKLRPSLRWLLLALGLVLVTSLFWFRGQPGDNARSRIITVERLVERNTWAHIAPGDTTPFQPSIDVIKIGDRIYSSKPPLYPLIMAGEGKVVKAVAGWEFYAHRKDYLRFLILLNQILPYMVMLWVAMRWLATFTQDSWTQHFMLLAMSLGCLAYGYAPEVNNHAPGACLLFLATHQVHRVWTGQECRWWVMGLIGLLIGMTVSFELPAVAFGLLLWGLVVWRNWRGGLAAAVGMLLPVLPSMLVFHAISGEWKPYYFQGKLYRFEGSYWQRPQDSDALQEPQLVYFLKTLFGVKGLFVVTPLFALPVMQLLPWVRRRVPRLLPMLAWMALPVLALIGYYGLRTHNYGGDCLGMRWWIVFMPLLMFMAWPVVQWAGRTAWGKVACIALLLGSMFQNLIALKIDCFVDIYKVF